MDPNTQVMAVRGEEDGLTAAANQVHYKTLKGLNQKEYSDDLGARSYVEAVLGVRHQDKKKENEVDSEWKTVENRRTFKERKELYLQTVFLAKIPANASAEQVWDWVIREGKINFPAVRDIILPKKRDKFNNRYGFLKIKGNRETEELVGRLKKQSYWGRI